MNNWYVITGAPSSGKTTILQLLNKKGYQTIPEAARVYIDNEMEKGKTIEQIRKNEMKFQEKIYDLKVIIEKNLSKSKILFFDRGIHDTVAYLQLYSYPVKAAIISGTKKAHYKKVFLFERLPYIKDYTRTENENTLQKLEELLFQTYAAYGNTVVRVPVLSVKKRADFILQNI